MKKLTNISGLTNVSHKVAAFATTGALTLMGDNVYASNLSDVTGNIESSASGMPKVISIAAYLLGAVFIVSGILSLKKHVDNPGQNPMNAALSRLAVGGSLAAAPKVVDILIGSTVGDGGTGASFTQGFGDI